MFDFSNNFDSTPDVVVGLIFFFPINEEEWGWNGSRIDKFTNISLKIYIRQRD